MIAAAVVLIAATGWFAIVIWSAWRARWLLGSLIGVGFVTVLVLLAQRVAGPQPVAYGLLLAMSLFLGAALFIVGLIHAAVALAVRRRDGE